MKNNIILAVLATFTLLGCANPSKIHQRSINRGYEHTDKIVTINTADTIEVNGKDSIVFRDVEVKCPNYEAQPRRYEVRYAYKIKRDTLRLIKYQTKWKAKEKVKVERIKEKGSFWGILRYFIIGLIVGWFIRNNHESIFK